MKFLKSKNGKVTICILKNKVTVFEKKIGGQFSINGQEMYQNDAIELENTTEAEAVQFFINSGFMEK